MAARSRPFKTKSELARKYATEVALAACEGLITTQLRDETFTNVWMITADGLAYIEGFENVLGS